LLAVNTVILIGVIISTKKAKNFDLDEFLGAVQRNLDGVSSELDNKLLLANRASWVAALLRNLDTTQLAIDETKRTLRGHVRSLVISDYQSEYKRIDEVLTSLIGPAKPKPTKRTGAGTVSGVVQLQISWQPGKIIVWASGHEAEPETTEELKERLELAGADSIDWVSFDNLRVPGQGKVAALSAPIGACLGWLVALGSSTDDEATGVSVAWMGILTALAVRLVGQGRAVPQLRKHRKRRNNDLPKGASKFEVRWSPALVESKEYTNVTNAMPATVGIFDDKGDRKSTTGIILNDIITAIFREAASRLDFPSAPENPETEIEISETFMAYLEGKNFVTSGQLGGELARKIDQWTKQISGARKSKLVVRLDEPDESNAWYLSVLGVSSDRKLLPVEQVIVNSSAGRSKEVEDDLQRLERLYPELLRPGAKRRGEVILSQQEAWLMMGDTGRMLIAAGFDVRAPQLSTKKAAPALRLTSQEAQESVVGAQQLANVSWSVLFDEIELNAEQIRELASEARPLIESNGKWVEIDKIDLQEAAAALEERADQNKMSGADMLRHALGLEGSVFSGGVSLAGEGWASDLIKSASEISDDISTTPEGFKGELRSYQAEARTWLGFLDGAGLGGCLALDMGLGKTPTMLAHINLSTGNGPSLVIAPPAVVTNWAAEAAKFVPDLKVKVHHGPSRESLNRIGTMSKKFDLIITTYGTAVRDIEALAKVEWDKVVLDEAQAIKNPASETAQQLRKLNARSRVALTGTPIENGLGDLWSIMDFANPGLVGSRASFVSQLSDNGTGKEGAEKALKALNGILVFRRTKAEPAIAAELPDRIDELDQCTMTEEQIGLYQAILDSLVIEASDSDAVKRKGAVLAAITGLKQICNHPAAFDKDYSKSLEGRSGKLIRLNEIIETVFAAGERMLVFTHFASWGEKMAEYLTDKHGVKISCYHGGMSRGARDKLVADFQSGKGAGAMVVSLKAGGTGLNLTAANHVVLYDRWWNPAVEDQARDRVWRIGQKNTVVCHRLVCPGTVDERVEEVVAGKRQIADMVLPKSSSVGDLDAQQLQVALGLDADVLLVENDEVLEGSNA